MKYTKLFIKYTLIGISILLMLILWLIAAIMTLVSIFGLASNQFTMLLLLPIALTFTFAGFLLLDLNTYLIDKWFN